MMDNEHSYSVQFTRRGDRMVGEITGQTQIRFDEYSLSRGLFKTIPPRAGDLLRIGLSVYAVDRLACRNRGDQSGRSRVMHLEVSVVETDFWSDKQTLTPMRNALELLSGDTWHLRFRACTPDTEYLSCRPDEHPRICLYSGGLDSAAGLATRLRTRREPMLPVIIWQQARQKSRTLDQLHRMASRYGADVQPVVVRTAFFKPPPTVEQEWSQRCRSFLFLALGGAVACAEEADKVEVYESGIGAINLPLMHGMATGARTTKSSHPRFLRLMSDLVSRVAERRIDICLPHRNHTKADIVRTLAEDGLGDLAAATDSCVRFLVRGKARHCGYCPACIGRRQAMMVAGVSEPDGAYEYDLFGSSQTVNAIEPAKLENLKATLMQVERLGELCAQPLPEWFLAYAIGTGVAEDPAALRDWVDVLLRYRAEWRDLIAQGQSKGWDWAGWLPASSAA